jgi:glycosyltransferase involved in cell wall biosynthesis
MRPAIAFTSRLPVGEAGGIESALRELVPRVAQLKPDWDVVCVHAFRRHTLFSRLPFFGDLLAAAILYWNTRRFDVVVINGAEYAWPRMLQRRARRHTVTVWHGTRAAEIPALAARMNLAVRAYLRLETWLQRWALCAARQIAVSLTTRTELRETYAYRAEIAIASNGAPPAITNGIRGRPRHRQHVAWIGTNPYKKGLDVAIASCRIARRRFPGLRLVAIGVGPGAAESEPWVECTGRLTHEAALERLATCSVLLGSTRYEGCSVAVIEALALGVPVIAGPCVGWMVGAGGIALENLEPLDFARVLEELLGDDERLERMSDEAKARARHFDWSQAAQVYAAEIESCL